MDEMLIAFWLFAIAIVGANLWFVLRDASIPQSRVSRRPVEEPQPSVAEQIAVGAD